MKLVIEVKKEDYKRYKEDKICSYTSAVLDAVPFIEVLDKIKADIADRPSFMMATSEEYVRGVNAMLYQALSIIDKYRREQE